MMGRKYIYMGCRISRRSSQLDNRQTIVLTTYPTAIHFQWIVESIDDILQFDALPFYAWPLIRWRQQNLLTYIHNISISDERNKLDRNPS